TIRGARAAQLSLLRGLPGGRTFGLFFRPSFRHCTKRGVLVMRNFLRSPHWPSGGLPHALVIACGVALLAVGLPMAMALGSSSPARPALSVPSSAQQGKGVLRLADTATATATL